MGEMEVYGGGRRKEIWKGNETVWKNEGINNDNVN